MKKRKFYNNKARNAKWTEEPKGHEIDFAEKYVEGASYGDMLDEKRPSYQAQQRKKQREKRRKKLNIFLSVALSLVIISVGYTAMDVHMLRHAKPLESIGYNNDNNDININDIAFNISGYKAESVSLDSSVMLSSVSSELEKNGFTGLIFDAKRSDGTIGYASSLASIDTYGAISNPASNPRGSIKKLVSMDILPVARISCYTDNVVPLQDATAGIMQGGKPYSDENGNYYLNPNSESAYSYIKDIIAECHTFGIDVFILTGCELPEEISENYNDGFDNIVKRLNADFNNEIKFLQEIDIEIVGKDDQTGRVTNSAINKEIEKIKKINKNQILYIKSKIEPKRLNNLLNRHDINCFVIEE